MNEQMIPRPTFSLTPRTLEEAMGFAKMMAGSDLVPKDYRGKPENCLLAVQMGAEVGLSPMQAIQNIAVINGRPAVWGDAMLAIVQAHPAYEWHKEWTEGENGAMVAACQVKRRGNEPHTATFSMADARLANLLGKDGPWKNYPKRMLQLRARAYALRNMFADALRGLASAEEVQDSDAPAAVVVSEPQRLPAPPTSQTLDVPANPPLPTTPAALPESQTAPQTETVRGVVTDTKVVAGNKTYYQIEIETPQGRAVYFTGHEDAYQLAARVEGTDHLVEAEWRNGRVEKKPARALVSLTLVPDDAPFDLLGAGQ